MGGSGGGSESNQVVHRDEHEGIQKSDPQFAPIYPLCNYVVPMAHTLQFGVDVGHSKVNNITRWPGINMRRVQTMKNTLKFVNPLLRPSLAASRFLIFSPMKEVGGKRGSDTTQYENYEKGIRSRQSNDVKSVG
jgi:hypothetical protein